MCERLFSLYWRNEEKGRTWKKQVLTEEYIVLVSNLRLRVTIAAESGLGGVDWVMGWNCETGYTIQTLEGAVW